MVGSSWAQYVIWGRVTGKGSWVTLCSRGGEYASELFIMVLVLGKKSQVVLTLDHRLPSHQAPIVPCSPSFLVLWVFFLALARVALFGLLGVCFILGVFIHGGLFA